jgi:hypothetical protein
VNNTQDRTRSTTDTLQLAARPTLNPSVSAQVGPRQSGVTYLNADGAFRVVKVITDPSEASRLLNRDSAQYAVWVVDTLRRNAEPFVVGSAWTCSDRIITKAAV